MKVVYSERHLLRDAKTELLGGELIAPLECPRRVATILAACEQRGFGALVPPQEFGEAELHARLAAVHSPPYLAFVKTAWQEWERAGYKGEAIATSFPMRRMAQKPPDEIDGKLGYYCFAAETSITAGTWAAAQAAAGVALTAAQLVASGEEPHAFALCRPPGHHAAVDMYGGYCFYNNAALAAQAFLDAGRERVAVLDIDFHHGNGTQDIFYERDDVLFVSLHGEPQNAFPYFSGYADETGTQRGQGYNVNYPMPPNTAYSQWADALKKGLARIDDFAAQALVVSLGVDVFEKDPIGFFKLTSDDFSDCGKLIAELSLPTTLVLEGGYAVDEIGTNVVNTLQAFAAAHQLD